MARKPEKGPTTRWGPPPTPEVVSPWVPVSLSDAEQQDLLRRIARNAPGVERTSDAAVILMPNGTTVRVWFDRDGTPTRWDTMR